MDFNKLIRRVKSVLISPKTEWPLIAGEPASVGSLYSGYIAILAAVPAICSLGIGIGLGVALVSYLLSLVSIFVVALIIDTLAPTFGGEKNRVQALKTAAYAYTASWVAGIGILIPSISIVTLLAGAAYSIYLLYLGLPHTMKAPAERAGGYAAVTVVIAMVLSWIIGGTLALFVLNMEGTGDRAGAISGSGSSGRDASPGELESSGKPMGQAGQQMAAQDSGNKDVQAETRGEMRGSAFGAGGRPAAVLEPSRLQDFAPHSLDGLPRSAVSSQRSAAMGLQVSSVKATYRNDSGRNLRLEITDAGGAREFLAMAGWTGLEDSTETAAGYERTYRADGRTVHEEWDNAHNSGEYGLVVGERFMVRVQGQAASIGELKEAIGELDLGGLESLRNEGVKGN